MNDSTKQTFDKVYNTRYDMSSDHILDQFMESLLAGFTVVSWRGKKYHFLVQEIMEGIQSP